MKRVIIMMCMALCVTQGHAQNARSRMRQAFDDFRRQAHEDFDDFRRQCMEDYLSFVTNPWKEFKAEEPQPKPKDDEVTPVPMPHDDDKKQEDRQVVIEEVVTPEPVEPQPEPVAPIEEEPVVEVKYVDFSFFGTQVRVRFDPSNKVTLSQLTEQGVASALRRMSQSGYDNMILDCLALRSELRLCDWGYLQMLKHLADAVHGAGTNDAALLLSYLYVQSGYKSRMAYHNNKLYMLYASRHEIYGARRYYMDGTSYYSLDELPANLNICEAAFRKEKELSLYINESPQLALLATPVRTLSTQMVPGVTCGVSTNQNLIDFYNTYPTSECGGNFLTRWAMYANTPLESSTRQQLYGELRRHINGKSPLEALQLLLHFVQWTIVYGYDDQIWGHDRAFFSEESLFYPKADCEDHAILFSRMVRDLLGMKVALVYYPGHLATAVKVPEAVTGDYLMINGERFMVCDPTCTGANVGQTMRGMDNRQAKAIVLE